MLGVGPVGGRHLRGGVRTPQGAPRRATKAPHLVATVAKNLVPTRGSNLRREPISTGSISFGLVPLHTALTLWMASQSAIPCNDPFTAVLSVTSLDDII